MADHTLISRDDDCGELLALRAALATGEASGEPDGFDFDAFIEAKKA